MPVIPWVGLYWRAWDRMDSIASGLESTAREQYSRRTSMSLASVAARDQRQELAAQGGVLEEHATHDRVDHLAVHVLHATPGHAVVAGLHDDGQTVGLGLLLDQVGQLHHGLLLDLGAPHDPLGQPGVLGQADDVGV